MDLESRKLGMKIAVEESELAIALASAEGSWRGLADSIKHDVATLQGATSSANWIKSVYRPFLTTLLVAMAMWVFYLIWQALSAKDQHGIYGKAGSKLNSDIRILKAQYKNSDKSAAKIADFN